MLMGKVTLIREDWQPEQSPSFAIRNIHWQGLDINCPAHSSFILDNALKLRIYLNNNFFEIEFFGTVSVQQGNRDWINHVG